jgi:PPK2 family polyphosphate:nucleotide phosphotransferase
MRVSHEDSPAAVDEEKRATGPLASSSITKEEENVSGPIIVRSGSKIRLTRIDPDAKPNTSKRGSVKQIKKLQERLIKLQEALYAENRRSLLVIFQAIDTGGKDGAIKNLCHGLDPSGVELTNFKAPSVEELDHDFLWRIHRAAPRRGAIGVWNRSHYEDVFVPRVHKHITRKVWRERYEDINAFEKLLSRQGVTILKFFLHISKEEQKTRLENRLKDPEKIWKFNPGDLTERALWDDYQRAFEDAINACATDYAPWYIIPANRKWARNLMTLQIVADTLEGMRPQYPPPQFDPKTVTIE